MTSNRQSESLAAATSTELADEAWNSMAFRVTSHRWTNGSSSWIDQEATGQDMARGAGSEVVVEREEITAPGRHGWS